MHALVHEYVRMAGPRRPCRGVLVPSGEWRPRLAYNRKRVLPKSVIHSVSPDLPRCTGPGPGIYRHYALYAAQRFSIPRAMLPLSAGTVDPGKHGLFVASKCVDHSHRHVSVFIWCDRKSILARRNVDLTWFCTCEFVCRVLCFHMTRTCFVWSARRTRPDVAIARQWTLLAGCQPPQAAEGAE